MARTGPQKVERIYLHWTAGSYNCPTESSYHTVVNGAGEVRKATDYNTGLDRHTLARNRNSVSISTCCMGGTPWETYPCKQVQIDAMTGEAARLAKSLGWTASDVTVQKILTHAEAGGLRDYPISLAEKLNGSGNKKSVATGLSLPHENYGPQKWFDGWPGGLSERWDWAQTKKTDRMGEGGIILRKLILEKMGAEPPKSSEICDDLAAALGGT